MAAKKKTSTQGLLPLFAQAERALQQPAPRATAPKPVTPLPEGADSAILRGMRIAAETRVAASRWSSAAEHLAHLENDLKKDQVALASMREYLPPGDIKLQLRVHNVARSQAYLDAAKKLYARAVPVKPDAKWQGATYPKSPRNMTATEINRELDKLQKQASAIGDRIIAAGRGRETFRELEKMTDPLANEHNRIYDRIRHLRSEIESRYGSSISRLPPRGYPPRSST